MQNFDQLLGGGADLGSLGARFGLSPEQTNAALGSLMPAILGGFQKRADAGHAAPVPGTDQPVTQAGIDVLGHIFGSKDVSRQVADHAAERSGVSNEVLKAMLPVVAAMVARHLAGGGAGGIGGGAGGLGGMLGSLLNGGGLGGLGGAAGSNPLDQILARMR